MIGRITLMWVGLAAGVAAGLFQVKYEVQALEGRLNRINRAVLADQQAIHVLKAEWSYLNQPNELGKRAQEVLSLKPMAAAQIGAVADLPARSTDSNMIAQVEAVPPSQVAKLKGPAPSIASVPQPAQPAAARPLPAPSVAGNPSIAAVPLNNPMLASAKPRQ